MSEGAPAVESVGGRLRKVVRQKAEAGWPEDRSRKAGAEGRRAPDVRVGKGGSPEYRQAVARSWKAGAGGKKPPEMQTRRKSKSASALGPREPEGRAWRYGTFGVAAIFSRVTVGQIALPGQ